MKSLLQQIFDIATKAGEEILDVYENEFGVDYKNDGSPLTMADRRAHNRIVEELQNVSLSAPIVSEESDANEFEQRHGWDQFWMVDPLDGTKEFVKRNGEFTVNIALIKKGEPILGVVHTPVKGMTHFAAKGIGAFKMEENSKAKEIRVKAFDPGNPIMVASRSHSGPEVEEYRNNLETAHSPVSITSMGSSLKICLVAEGSADVYPRLGPTSEWDTAAAHCVLSVAGGSMIDIDGSVLKYNKSNILNPWFLACGDQNVEWLEFLGNLD